MMQRVGYEGAGPGLISMCLSHIYNTESCAGVVETMFDSRLDVHAADLHGIRTATMAAAPLSRRPTVGKLCYGRCCKRVTTGGALCLLCCVSTEPRMQTPGHEGHNLDCLGL